MPKPAPFSPLRLLSPAQLIFCLILFFLPWIELQCVPPKELMKDMPKEQVEKFKKEMGIDPTKPMPFLAQSGLQIASGEASIASSMKKQIDQKGGGGTKEVDELVKKSKNDGGTAPLLYALPVALIAGIIFGFVPLPGNARRFVVLGCCLAALAVVGSQAAMGFPMEQELKKEMSKQSGLGGFGPGPNVATRTGAKEEAFRVSWQIPLYLTFLLLLGAAGTAFVDGGVKRKKPKRPVYEIVDDEEDFDDDRPRRKKKPVVEDEDEEDEEERPKKKRRRDDDD